MRTVDHKVLAEYILSKTDNELLLHYRNAFIIGSLEPDYNLFSYLRGSIKNKNLYGHNISNSNDYINRTIENLMENGVASWYDAFQLGALIHYISDAFTHPHTTQFNESITQHVIYEEKLHRYLINSIKCDCDFTNSSAEGNNASTIWTQSQEKYLSTKPSIKKDCVFIISICSKITELILLASNPYKIKSFVPVASRV